MMQDHLEIAISNQASQLYNFEDKYFQEYVKILEIFILKSKSPYSGYMWRDYLLSCVHWSQYFSVS